MYPKRDPIDIEKNPMEINGISGISWDDLNAAQNREQSKKFAQAEHMKHMKHLTIASFPNVPVRVPNPSKIKARCCCSITSIFEGFIWKISAVHFRLELVILLGRCQIKMTNQWRTNRCHTFLWSSWCSCNQLQSAAVLPFPHKRCWNLCWAALVKSFYIFLSCQEMCVGEVQDAKRCKIIFEISIEAWIQNPSVWRRYQVAEW